MTKTSALKRSTSKSARLPESKDLLAWYDRHRRRLPWRALPGRTSDPYAVWLSEIMLQQTTVTAVKPYYENFLWLWPTVEGLAAAPVADVMTAWAGLGYYARARNLHKCAGVVVAEHGGIFPDTEDALRALAARLTPLQRSGDYAQGVMDLGATVCTPKSPACVICPWADVCEGRKLGIAETLPRKAKKVETPLRHGVAFWMVRAGGDVALQRRPPKGLLGGMTEVPGSDWRAQTWSEQDAGKAAPLKAKWRALPGIVTHTFTHFRLEVAVHTTDLSAAQARKLGSDIIWTPLAKIGDAGLPSVMAKVAAHALNAIA
jgi:A/G-specific adenine glycosylase